jgi:hypothetical protein
MTRTRWNVTDPGDDEIREAWEKWQFTMTMEGRTEASRAKYAMQADQWRQMYQWMVERRDARLGGNRVMT